MGLGDELMVTGHVRQVQLLQSGARLKRVRVLYEKPGRWSPVFDHNPRIARPGEQGDFDVYHARVNGLRPYIAAKTPSRWTWKPYAPPPGELYFTPEEQSFAAAFSPDVIVEPHLRAGASPNKDWGWDRWQALVGLLRQAGRVPVQLGPPGARGLIGAERIVTASFRQAAAVLARARTAILPEGGLHHAAAALGVPAVVLFGGYISPQVTGYASQAGIFTGKGLGCGARTPCECCRTAMASITPERVLTEMGRLGEREGVFAPHASRLAPHRCP